MYFLSAGRACCLFFAGWSLRFCAVIRRLAFLDNLVPAVWRPWKRIYYIQHESRVEFIESYIHVCVNSLCVRAGVTNFHRIVYSHNICIISYHAHFD